LSRGEKWERRGRRSEKDRGRRKVGKRRDRERQTG